LLAVYPLVSAAIDITLLDIYQNTATSARTTGARGLAIDRDRGLLFVAAAGVDEVTILNISDPSNIVAAGSIADSAPAGSLDGVWFIDYNPDNYMLYASAPTDDGITILNLTHPTSIVSASSVVDSANPGSLDGAYAATYFTIGDHYYIAASSSVDDTLAIYNATPPTSTPVAIVDRTAAANPCSTDNLRMLYNIPGTTIIIGASPTDDTISVFNISSGGVINCVGDYTDSASPNSVDGIQQFYYDNETNLLYAVSDTDGELTILNYTHPSAETVVGAYDAPSSTMSVTLINESSYKYAVIGSGTPGINLSIVNVTVPSSPSLVQSKTLYDSGVSSCGMNITYNMVSDGSVVYATQTNGNCVMAFDTIVSISDSCTYGGSGDWNVDAADECSITSEVDLGGNSIFVTGTGNFFVDAGGRVRNFARMVCSNVGLCRAVNGGRVG
jgi:hypothetical protein